MFLTDLMKFKKLSTTLMKNSYYREVVLRTTCCEQHAVHHPSKNLKLIYLWRWKIFLYVYGPSSYELVIKINNIKYKAFKIKVKSFTAISVNVCVLILFTYYNEIQVSYKELLQNFFKLF